MLSGVLRSKGAVQVNVEIMRAFVRLRRMLASNEDLLNLDLVFVPLAKQLDWLRAAGFSDVKSYWQERREALFGGRKI